MPTSADALPASDDRRVALVTGAGRGIGRGVAVAPVARGLPGRPHRAQRGRAARDRRRSAPARRWCCPPTCSTPRRRTGGGRGRAGVGPAVGAGRQRRRGAVRADRALPRRRVGAPARAQPDGAVPVRTSRGARHGRRRVGPARRGGVDGGQARRALHRRLHGGQARRARPGAIGGRRARAHRRHGQRGLPGLRRHGDDRRDGGDDRRADRPQPRGGPARSSSASSPSAGSSRSTRWSRPCGSASSTAASAVRGSTSTAARCRGDRGRPVPARAPAGPDGRLRPAARAPGRRAAAARRRPGAAGRRRARRLLDGRVGPRARRAAERGAGRRRLRRRDRGVPPGRDARRRLARRPSTTWRWWPTTCRGWSPRRRPAGSRPTSRRCSSGTPRAGTSPCGRPPGTGCPRRRRGTGRRRCRWPASCRSPAWPTWSTSRSAGSATTRRGRCSAERRRSCRSATPRPARRGGCRSASGPSWCTARPTPRCPVECSRTYARTAAEAGDDVLLHELDGVGHFELIDPLSAAWPTVLAAVKRVSGSSCQWPSRSPTSRKPSRSSSRRDGSLPTSTSAVSARTLRQRGQPVGHRPHRLGAEPAPPGRRGQPVADLQPPLVVRRPGGAAVADHPAVLGQGDEPAAVVRPAVLHPHPQPVEGVGVRVARRERQPRVLAGEQRAGLVDGLRHEDERARSAASARSCRHGDAVGREAAAACSLGSSRWRAGSPTGRACGCTSSPARAAPARPRSPPRSPWPWPARAAGPCSSRSRTARASRSSSTRPPLPYEERKVAVGPGGGDVFALAVDPEEALARVPRHVLPARPGRPRAAPDRRHRLRDDDRAGHARRAAHRQGLRGGTSPQGQHAHVYDAVVLDAPPTGRITRFLGVNEEVAGLAQVGPIRGQADSIMCAAAQPDDRGAPRDPARGDAGPGDRRRGHRAGQGRAAGRRRRRQRGARAAAQAGRPHRGRQGPARPRRVWPGLAAAGVDGPRPGRRRAAGRGRASTPSRVALEKSQRRAVKALQPADVRPAAARREASTSARSTSWPSSCAGRAWHERP